MRTSVSLDVLVKMGPPQQVSLTYVVCTRARGRKKKKTMQVLTWPPPHKRIHGNYCEFSTCPECRAELEKIFEEPQVPRFPGAGAGASQMIGLAR